MKNAPGIISVFLMPMLWGALFVGLNSLVVAAEGPARTPLKIQSAKASSTFGDCSADRAIDGVVGGDSRWVSQKSSEPAWLEVNWVGAQKIAGIHLFSGINNMNALQKFVVQFWRDGQWHDIPSAAFENNQSTALAIPFDDTVEVTTDRLRMWITPTHPDFARVLEIMVWPASAGGVPPIASKKLEFIPLVYLNQSGLNLGKPKRFTAPTLSAGMPFEIRTTFGGEARFTGKLNQEHIGDFSAFNPEDAREFVVVAGTNVSVPFRIGPWWLERVTYQDAVDFMSDSRHYLGNERAVCKGSFGWRDDHHFGWELHTLVPQWLSNPSAYERMPHQIKYEKPANPKLWGALEPYSDDAPDLVKLIHWGADVIVSQGATHELLKSQLAYFLYAWPWLKDYLPAQNYTVVRDFAFAHWSDATCDHTYPYDESAGHDLLAPKTKIGSTKGSLSPGFSIEPNLLLYEVAKREQRPDAEEYFQAAFKQTEWMIANRDWNDPQVTKGQRMSEFITMTGLAHFLRGYPNRAPVGLAAKINAWAAVIIRRSDNLWDFRMLDDGARWTPMGEKPTMWNEPGNVVGLNAALLAAQPFLTNAATAVRFDELVWSHFDNMFGRNPTGRHFSYDAPREIEGVEHGLFSFASGGIGRLANARFVIDGSPKDGHYPYHPEKGDFGWTEGWIQFNTPFNVSLAYLAHAETQITVRRDGSELVVKLEAPLNFDYAKAESGKVWLNSSNGDAETVVFTEESPSSRFFTGRNRLRTAAAQPGDEVLQATAGATVTAGYGFGYLGWRAAISL